MIQSRTLGILHKIFSSSVRYSFRIWHLIQGVIKNVSGLAEKMVDTTEFLCG